MAEMRQLEVYMVLDGSCQVGYERIDLPLIHAIAAGELGRPFQPGKHWPCDVCKEHGFSEADFHTQYPAACERFQQLMAKRGH